MTVPWSARGSTLLPGHSCPWPRDETKVAFCGVGRAAEVATSDRAAGQPPAPLTSRPLCPVPSSPASPPQCRIPGTRAVPASLRRRATEHIPRDGAAAPKRAPGPAWWRAGERADARGGLPAPSTPPQVPVPVSSPGGHLGVGDLGGFLGQAAALGGDQVVVLGHVLVRVVQAAGAGPGWGPRGHTGGCSAWLPSARGWATWGQPQRVHRAGSGSTPRPRQPPPKNPDPAVRDFQGGHWADRGHPLGIQALPRPSQSRDGHRDHGVPVPGRGCGGVPTGCRCRSSGRRNS